MSEKKGYSRRDFLKVVGAGSGLAAAGCADELPEKLIPYVVQPDEVIPGVAAWYSGYCTECSAGCGVLVRTREGRSVKIEGNPLHPVNLGGVCARGQSSIQAHYDPDRVREPLRREPTGAFQTATWKDGIEATATALTNLGEKKAVFITPRLTGSLKRLVGEFSERFPNVIHVEHEGLPTALHEAAARASFGDGQTVHYDFSKAKVVVSVGADFLETWLSPVEFARQWAETRRDPHNMSYFVHVEPRLSLTAGNADKWVKNAPGSEAAILMSLLSFVSELKGGSSNSLVAGFDPAKALADTGVSEAVLRDIAKRLVAAPSSLVVAGGASTSSPFGVECGILANAINATLGNIGTTVLVRKAVASPVDPHALERVIEEIRTQKLNVGVLLTSGVNPAYLLPAKVGYGEAVGKVDVAIAVSTHLDESANAANWVLPLSTSMESWSDSVPAPEVYNLNQPSMAPLYQSQSLGDTLLAVALKLDPKFSESKSFADYMRSAWKSRVGQGDAESFDARWTKYVETGGDWSGATDAVRGVGVKATFNAQALKDLAGKIHGRSQAKLSVLVYPNVNSADGSSANRPWMQELPNPVTTVVWGSWVEVHPDTAAKYRLSHGDVARVRTQNGAVEVPVYVSKHIHPSLVAIPIGQGHDSYGRYAAGIGANALAILAPGGGLLSDLLESSPLATSMSADKLVKLQGHDYQDQRGISRTVPRSKLLRGGNGHGSHGDHGKESHGKNGHDDHGHGDYGKVPPGVGQGVTKHHDPLALGPQETPRQMYEQMEHPLYKWGMSIDLASCTGCSACIVACYAENNVPVVGKEMCAQGREMSWLRIERYLEDDHPDQPVSSFLPMMCQHCGNAPCEPVCPVYATYHNEEGLNSMIYNRCVGTRYCANNCSYKVRRFNWFHYKWPEPLTWQLNPDVTVREVGIMEKCTFCVQRIVEAKNRAKDLGRAVEDGEAVPACASTCPTKAITFGNLIDRESKVFENHQSERSYKVLDQYINTQPAIAYLARIRNDIES